MAKELGEADRKMRTLLVGIAFVLFSIFILGLFWLSTTPADTVTYALAYAAGLSMIVLPCTLPLVFVIIPLSIGKGYKKGLIMAALFGLGLTLTITAYGVFIAFAGGLFGLDQTTQIMWLIGGGAAFLFGLTELKLITIKLPAYGGATPKFIEQQGDYLKAFFLGLFLGNAGVGCPNPAFYVLLGYIATTGNVLTGASLGFIHGLGRATPLIFFAILAILGVNATQGLLKKKQLVEKLIGWGLIIIGAFIIINALPGGHLWFEQTFVHGGWNQLLQLVGGSELAEQMGADPHGHEEVANPYVLWVFLSLIAVPVVWNFWKKRRKKK